MTVSDQNKFNSLRGWLNRKPHSYQQGLMLMMAYSDNQVLIDTLQKYENDHLMEKSIRAMYNQLKAGTATVETPEMSAQPVTNEPTPVVQHMVQAPAVKKPSSQQLRKITEIKTARVKLHKERARCHNTMCDIAFDEDGNEKEKLSAKDIERRYELVKMIMEYTEKLKAYYDVLDHWEATGELLETDITQEEKKEALTKAEALKRLKNSVAPNLSKVKGKIEKAEQELAGLQEIAAPNKALIIRITKLKEKIAEWELQRQALEAEKEELETLLDE